MTPVQLSPGPSCQPAPHQAPHRQTGGPGGSAASVRTGVSGSGGTTFASTATTRSRTFKTTVAVVTQAQGASEVLSLTGIP